MVQTVMIPLSRKPLTNLFASVDWFTASIQTAVFSFLVF
jgi:hypothetical protein